jgi:First Longin domain of INTU, CCZ1 and HPS4
MTSSSTPSTKTTTTPSSSPFLSSFYIYNPSLGQSDASVHEQLVFHYSPETINSNTPSPTASSRQLDNQLRAIGLAQGIIQFALAFSPDEPVREVRTQKGFTVPLEVENGWWMLAV